MSEPIASRQRARLPIAVLGTLLVLVVSAVGGWTYASPYLFARSLKAAALNGDRAKLEEMVDFPRVREGIKGDLKLIMSEAMQAEAGKSGADDNPLGAAFAEFAVGLLGMATDSVVDQLVSPAGLEKAFTGEPTSVQIAGERADPLERFLPARKDGSRGEVRGRYLVFSRFRYTVSSESKNARFDIDLKRRGLVGWQVVRVTPRLSPRLFAEADESSDSSSAQARALESEGAAQKVTRLVGEVNAGNAAAFLESAFIPDEIVGVQVTIEPSEEADEKYGTTVDDEDGALAIWSGEFEMVVPKTSYHWLHGAYVVDGFFIPKNGGMHQGTISFGLEPVSEGQVRANPNLKIVDKGF